MRTTLAVTIALGVIISAHAQSTTKTELEGAWDAVWARARGGQPMKLGPGEVVSVTLEFRGDRLFAQNLLPRGPSGQPDKAPVELVFSVNTQTLPKQLDYWQPLGTDKAPVRFGPTNKIPASYGLAGNELRIEIPLCDDTGPRPTVVSGESKCSIMLVLRRR